MVKNTLNVLRAIGFFAGAIMVLAPLAIFLANFKRKSGRSTGAGALFRRGYGVLAIAIGFFALEFLLWRPLPITFPQPLDFVLAVIGFIGFIPSVGLYLWGLFTLGKQFGFSSSMGADLYQDHRLVQNGPFRFTRHPMYLAFILASVGANLLFHNWAVLILLLVSLVLVPRATHEEKLLESEFGEEWHAYANRVPKWLPWK